MFCFIELINICLNDLEVNNCKGMLKSIKIIFQSPEISELKTNELILKWINRFDEIESNYLNQILFFSISSRPSLWNEEILKALRGHFDKIVKNFNTIEMALDSWILLLKAQTKQPDLSLFNEFTDGCTEQVKNSFEKHRGTEIDQIWERIFEIARTICDDPNGKQSSTCKLITRALEDLNDFK